MNRDGNIRRVQLGTHSPQTHLYPFDPGLNRNPSGDGDVANSASIIVAQGLSEMVVSGCLGGAASCPYFPKHFQHSLDVFGLESDLKRPLNQPQTTQNFPQPQADFFVQLAVLYFPPEKPVLPCCFGA